jgi:hypothetical protein
METASIVLAVLFSSEAGAGDIHDGADNANAGYPRSSMR